MMPRLLGKQLALPRVAAGQPYLWFLGMMLFAVVNHWTGILGMPRRVYSAKYLGSAVAESWQAWTQVTALGGIVLFASSLCFLAVVIGTALFGKNIDAPASAGD